MKSIFGQLGNKNMQYIVALEKHKSVSVAAESLYISQPALSRYIHNLEARLGHKLFNRFGNQYIPTYEGERYIYHAKRIMELETQLENEFSSIDSDQRGRIRLALPALRSSYILPYILPGFYKLYPNVEVTLNELPSSRLEKVLLDGEVDYAFFNISVKHPDIVSTVVRYDRILLAVPHSHKMFGQGEQNTGDNYPNVDIAQFSGDTFIMQNWDQRTRQAADAIFGEARITPKILLVTRSIETSLKLVSNGLGLCFVPETYAKQIILPHPISFFSFSSPHATITLSLGHKRNTYQPGYFICFQRLSIESM